MQEVGHMSWNIYVFTRRSSMDQRVGSLLSLCDFVGGIMNANIWISHDVKMWDPFVSNPTMCMI